MAKQLTAAFVNSVKDAGKYFDGSGLGLILQHFNLPKLRYDLFGLLSLSSHR
jgi:hypothetical protein